MLNQVVTLDCDTEPHPSLILFASNPSTKSTLAKLYVSIEDENVARKSPGIPLLYAMGGKKVVEIWSIPEAMGEVF